MHHHISPFSPHTLRLLPDYSALYLSALIFPLLFSRSYLLILTVCVPFASLLYNAPDILTFPLYPPILLLAPAGWLPRQHHWVLSPGACDTSRHYLISLYFIFFCLLALQCYPVIGFFLFLPRLVYFSFEALCCPPVWPSFFTHCHLVLLAFRTFGSGFFSLPTGCCVSFRPRGWPLFPCCSFIAFFCLSPWPSASGRS